MKNLYYSVQKNILNEVIVHIEQRFKTMGKFRFIELLNPKLFHTYEKKFSNGSIFNFDIYI